MNWSQFFLGVVQLVVLALTWARERQLMDLGKQELIADLLRREADAISRATQARNAAADAIRNGGLRDDDGFRRPDD